MKRTIALLFGMFFCFYFGLVNGQKKPLFPQCPVYSLSPKLINVSYGAGQVYPTISVSTLDDCTDYPIENSFEWMSYVQNELEVTVSVTQNSGYTSRTGYLNIGDTCFATIVQGCHLQPGIADSISGETIVCQGQSAVEYSVPTITYASGYHWTLPSGATVTAGANTNHITVSFSTSATSGNITVYGTNDCKCGDGEISPNFHITVIQLPEAPLDVVSNKTNVCSNDPDSITLSAIGGSGTTFRWFRGQCYNGIEIGTGVQIKIPSPTQKTQYFGRWETACQNSLCKSVMVDIIQAPIVSIGQYPNPGQINGPEISLYANVQHFGGDGPSYLWTGPNAFYSTWPTPSTGVYHGGVTGPYHLVFTSHEGCVSNTAEWYLVIDGGKKSPLINNSIGFIKSDTNFDDLIIYPNPTSGLIYLYLNQKENLEITVYDNMGNSLIKKFNVNELDLNDFSSGTYLIKVKTTNKEITKIIMLSK